MEGEKSHGFARGLWEGWSRIPKKKPGALRSRICKTWGGKGEAGVGVSLIRGLKASSAPKRPVPPLCIPNRTGRVVVGVANPPSIWPFYTEHRGFWSRHFTRTRRISGLGRGCGRRRRAATRLSRYLSRTRRARFPQASRSILMRVPVFG
jgi:hypothetical protein